MSVVRVGSYHPARTNWILLGVDLISQAWLLYALQPFRRTA
jgi:hypothetical protein